MDQRIQQWETNRKSGTTLYNDEQRNFQQLVQKPKRKKRERIQFTVQEQVDLPFHL